MKQAVRVEAKTLWAGRAWIHAKYLNKAKNNNIPLIITHNGEKKVIEPTDLATAFDKNKPVKDYIGNKMTTQYGIVWKTPTIPEKKVKLKKECSHAINRETIHPDYRHCLKCKTDYKVW